MFPAAFAEFAFRPEGGEKFDARWDVRCFVGKDDGDDIIAIRGFAQVEKAAIAASGACDLALFAKVNIGFGCGEPIGAAGFDFDETERVGLVCDDVNLGVDDLTTPRTPYGKMNIRRHDVEAVTFEICDGELFARRAECDVRGGGVVIMRWIV